MAKKKEEPFFLQLITDEDIPGSVEVLLDKYQEGYKNGLGWPKRRNYRPGGPWVYQGRDKEKVELSMEANRLWLLGWDAGKKNQTPATIAAAEAIRTKEMNQRKVEDRYETTSSRPSRK